jgi:two-component system, OmpR family, sensor histidine kinase TorS
MLARLGIGGRLFIAFLGITALSLAPGVAGWLILREISAAQFRINSEALPAVAAAQRTAESSARLVATAPALNASRNETARAAQERELLGLVFDIRKSVTDAGLSPLDAASVSKLSSNVDALVSNLAVQSRLVRERLLLEQSFSERSEATIAAATAIVDLSETLVSNASSASSAVVSNLYSLIDDPSRHAEAYEALDRLIEQDIYQLDRMWELRLRSSQIGLLANRLTRALDASEVAEIAQGFQQHLRVVQRRVASIDDPVRREQARGYLGILESVPGSAPVAASLFGNRMRLLAIGEELGQLADDNRQLSAAVSRVAEDMLLKSEAFARATSAQAERAVSAGLYVLVISSLIAVALSGLIVWLFVERGVVRRLANLAGAMQRLTDGNLDVEVTHEGMPELKALSGAVVAFRDESKQRRALEIERERTNEELRRHREELRELVNERTLQLQQEVMRHDEARAKAESASRAKSDFLATMSHEIRTPMTGMLGMLRLLRDTEMSPSQQRNLGIAANSGEALLGILNSVLDYSKVESGKLPLDPESFCMADLLRGVTDLMRPAAAEKNLKLVLKLDRGLAAGHIGDAGKIRQIVFNLLSNAIKFTPHGSVRLHVSAEGEARQRLRIAVRDTGIGIPPQELEHIFEPFTQTDASITRHYGGTGLGLAISRRLAELMGGTLAVSSTPGQGSTFTLELELQTGARPGRGKAKGRRKALRAKPLKVLVVEDDAATREVACQFLMQLGHQPQAASDGYSAIDAYRSMEPDLVLMDISLPGIDGIATAKRLRGTKARHVPVIAMSAHVFREEVDRYLRSGMDAYVAKPLSRETLADAISTAMKESSPVDGGHVDRAGIEADINQLGRDAMMKIMAIVEQTIPQRFAAIRAALESQDGPGAAKLAHATHSAAASAGFTALASETRALEAAALGGLPDEANRLLGRCEASYAASIAEMRLAVMPA